ncbi:phage antirepressor KilAC domain-containing protein [Nonomuraea sp. ZG12]|uniref:phage antirepressor KilAC domain-containing protein n=1 Tax=Nonomuraea sp. ZG12 TaxID=3452207 RepID=UPI003F8B10BE
MPSEVKIFKDAQVDVRVLKEGDTFVIAIADLAKAWGYKHTPHLSRLLEGEDEKGVREVDTPGGRQKLVVVTEKGLNRLVSTLRRPELKEWQDKLYGEIIPTYNRTGMAVDTERVDLDDPEVVLALAARAGELAQKYRAERDLAHEKVVELSPKADRYDHFMNTAETKSIREVARMLKPYGIRERHFIDEILRDDFRWIDMHGTAAKVYAVNQGYMTNRVVHKPTGETVTQGRFTKKGIDRTFHKLGLGVSEEVA